jgi:hypothetical protein
MPFLIAGGVLSCFVLVLVLVVLVVRARAACDANALLAEEPEDDDGHPIHKLARHIVEDAYSRGASSIHVGSHEHVTEDGRVERRSSIRYRVDGALEHRMEMPAQALPAVIARFARMAGMASRRPVAWRRGASSSAASAARASTSTCTSRAGAVPTTSAACCS